MPVIFTNYRVGCNALSEQDSVGETHTTQYSILDDSKGCVKVCDSSYVTYYAKGDTTGTITWAVTNGTIISGQGTTTLVVQWGAAPALGSISLTETSLAGCSATRTICIEIIEKPQAAFCILPDTVAVDSVVICLNSTVVFKDLSTASVSSPIVSWLWNFGDGTATSSLHPAVSHTYSTSSIYTAYLVVTNQCGCKDNFFVKVNVLSDVGPDIYCASIACENDTASYHTSPGCGSYTWTVNGGTIVSGSGTTDIVVKWDAVDASGFGYVSLSSSCGHCPGTTTIKVPVIQSNPVVTGPTVMCTNKPYQLSIPLWPGTQYQWGVIGSPSSVIGGRYTNAVNVQFASAGTYTMHVSYQNKLKLCGGDLQFNVDVTDPPVISGDIMACKDAVATHIYNLSTGSGTWSLALPDGTYQTGSGSSFNATFPMSGVYTLSAIVVGICPPDPLTIVVDEYPIVVDTVGEPTLVCHDQPYMYNAGVPLSGSHFEWFVTSSTTGYTATIAPPTGNTVNITFEIPVGTLPIAGTFWQLHVKRVSNTPPFCEGHDTIINIYPIVVAPNVTGNTNVCPNTYENYSANWPKATNYTWKIIPNTAGSVVSGNSANNMTVLWNNYVSSSAKIIVTVTQCNDVVSDTLDVSINSASPMAVSPNPITICGGTGITFTATSGGSTYYWNFGDGTTTTTGTNTTTHTYSNTGSASTPFALTVYATGTGCVPSGTATALVTVLPAPYASIVCPGFNPCGSQFTTALLQAVLTGGSTYSFQWYYNGGAIPLATTNSYTVPSTAYLGNYTVTVTDNSSGCSTTSGIFPVDTIHCDTPCVPSGSVTVSATENCGTIVATGSGSGGGTSLSWTYPTTTTPTIQPVSVSGATTGTLTLVYTKEGYYPITYSEDFSGCRAESTVVVTVPVMPDFTYTWGCPGTNYTLNLTDYSAIVGNYHYNTSSSWEIRAGSSSGTVVASGSGATLSSGLATGTYWIEETVIVDPNSGIPGSSETCTVAKTLVVPVAITSGTIETKVGGVSVTSICEGVPVNISLATLPSGTSAGDASWDFGDGSGNLLNPTARTYTWGGFAVPQPRTISATFHDAVGCPYTATSVSFSIYPNTMGGDVSGPTVSCSGTPVTLSYSATPGTPSAATWDWSTGASTSTINVGTTGSYHVTVADIHQCPFTTKDLGVSFITLATPQIFGLTDYCEGDVVRLSAFIGGSPAYAYQWFRNGSALTTGSSIADIGLSAGTYSYYVVVTYTDPVTTHVCTVTSSTFVATVHGTPAAPTISGSVALDCSLYQLQLTGSHSSGATQYYTWSNGGFGQLDTIYTGGPYRLWYTDIYGCTSHADVSVPYSPESYFGWFPTGCYELCNGQLPLTMFGPPGIFAGWGWLYGGSYQSSGTHSVMDPLFVNAAGTYNMELNTGRCSATTADMNVSTKSCDNCPPLILNGTVMCDPTVPGGYTVNLNLNVTYPSTNCTIGTDIGPSVPFNAYFATPGAYGLTLNPEFAVA